jgi:hypothetical protein
MLGIWSFFPPQREMFWPFASTRTKLTPTHNDGLPATPYENRH